MGCLISNSAPRHVLDRPLALPASEGTGKRGRRARANAWAFESMSWNHRQRFISTSTEPAKSHGALNSSHKLWEVFFQWELLLHWSRCPQLVFLSAQKQDWLSALAGFCIDADNFHVLQKFQSFKQAQTSTRSRAQSISRHFCYHGNGCIKFARDQLISIMIEMWHVFCPSTFSIEGFRRTKGESHLWVW